MANPPAAARGAFLEVLLQKEPSREQWYSIQVFNERAPEAMRHLRALNRGIETISISRRPDGTCDISGPVPSDDQLAPLHLAFRHVYGKSEPGNLYKVLGIIRRCCNDPRMTLCVESLKRQSTESIVGIGFFKRGNESLTSRQLMDVFVNALLFHSDRERRVELEKLKAWLGSDGARLMCFHAVRDFVLACKNLNFLIKGVSSENPRVLLPRQFLGPK